MKIKIAAIGKLKAGPEQELFSRYLKRSRNSGVQVGISEISVQEYSESKAASVSQRKQQEANLLISNPGNGSVLVAFDENGRDLTSAQFSQYLAKERDDGVNEMVMVVGGADGLGDELLKSASTTIRLGAMTWPHQIVRILLAEQIYRAITILSGHPYHRQ
ncbi:MAG: 23S rRNA (pseudouridine(1915)-N(3))-methyltransferase RlmH [Rhizobiaceae bacterium]|nr:23S rRNA (pseudouridine(1915)-N(3))-methyltransferase RlmH [Rhizobiaceae bacterium]